MFVRRLESLGPVHLSSLLSAAFFGAGVAVAGTPLRVDVTRDGLMPRIAAGGHPSAEFIADFLAQRAQSAEAGIEPEPVFEPPLASGPYVNFESPPVKPLAFAAETGMLAVANTPNSSVALFDATGAALNRLREIPVGLDPVALAFQPGSNGRRLWVVNHVSDSVSVIDAVDGRLIGIVNTRDEPVNIVFNADGTSAFVVAQSGFLIAIDGSTLATLGEISIPAHTPRGAIFDPASNRVVVAAFHSGNNTTVVGVAFRHGTVEIGAPLLPTLFDAATFSETAVVFNASPELGPWPDTATQVTEPAPLVERIIPDAGRPSGWATIVDIFSLPGGIADPLKVAAYAAEVLDRANVTFTNPTAIVQRLIDDARDTLDHDLIFIDVADPAGMQIADIRGGVGTTLNGVSRNPANGQYWVTNREARNEIRHEPALNGHFIDHQVVIVDPAGGTEPAPIDLHAGTPNFNDTSTANPFARAASLADPQEVVFRADGARAYVVSLAADRVGVLDGASGAVLARVDVGRGPRGLVLDEVRQRLYVLNRTDMTLSTISDGIAGPAVIATTSLFNPEPRAVRDGRNFLYSASFSNNNASSCALCHPDGNLDHLAWDLGEPDGQLQFLPHVSGVDPCVPPAGLFNHPLKGPMVTLALKGLKDHAPFHWRGDRQEFVDFNGAFEKLLGGQQLSDADMAKYDAFIKSIVYPPTPNRSRDNSMSVSATRGREIFIAACNVCHALNHDGAQFVDCAAGDVALDLNFIHGQVQEIVQLRGVHKKFESDLYTGFGLLHDGREEREHNDHPIETFTEEFFPGFSAQDTADLIEFLNTYPTNVKPIVGWQLPVRNQTIPAGLVTMIGQHNTSPSSNDVIAKRYSNGGWTGYWMTSGTAPGNAVFVSDSRAALTLMQLLALASNATPVVFTAVTPGAGERAGVDQDLDSHYDSTDPCPQYANDGDMNGDGVVSVSDIAGFVLMLTDPAAFSAAFPNVQGNCAADLNASGSATVGDIGPFVTALTSP